MKSKSILYLFLVIVLKQIVWTAFIPLWHFPDEQAHFAQVQNVAEGNPKNPVRGNNTSEEIYQSEVFLETNRDGFGNNSFTYHPEFNIDYSDTTIGIYEEDIKQFDSAMRKNQIINEATVYPPLYYTIGAFVYRLFYQKSLFVRVFAVRLINIVLYLGIISVSFVIGKIVFHKDKIKSLTLTILVGFHPMLSFVSAGVSSDIVLTLLTSIAILVSLLVLTKPRPYHLAAMAVVFGVAWYTKPQAPLIAAIYLFPLSALFVRAKKKKLHFIIPVILSLLGFLGLLSRNYIRGAQLLPNIAASIPSVSIASIIFYAKTSLRQTYAQTMPWYWGVFRWLSLTLPHVANQIINRVVAIAFIGLVIEISISIKKGFHEKKRSEKILILSFLMYVSVVYALALIVYDYLFMQTHGFSLGMQGRYFFPTITAHMALLLIGIAQISSWFKRFSNTLPRLVGLGMICLQIVAMYAVVSSYYDVSSIATFFVQASQYKPMFFKSPYLETYLVAMIMSVVLFVWYYLRNEKRS